jgi:hypothetical protein
MNAPKSSPQRTPAETHAKLYVPDLKPIRYFQLAMLGKGKGGNG